MAGRGLGPAARLITRTCSKKALRIEPNNPMAPNDLGYYTVEGNENLPEALKLIQRAVDVAPTAIVAVLRVPPSAGAMTLKR